LEHGVARTIALTTSARERLFCDSRASVDGVAVGSTVDPRRLVHKPECWNVSYSWYPRRVMITGTTVHVLDVTLRYPLSAGKDGLLPPAAVTDHEVTSR
jgi:hypothetical protein